MNQVGGEPRDQRAGGRGPAFITTYGEKRHLFSNCGPLAQRSRVSGAREASNTRVCARLWLGTWKYGPLRQSMRFSGKRIEAVSEVRYASNDGANS